MTLLEKAIRIAGRAHEGQKRKGADLPYVTHVFAVALLLAGRGFPEDIIAAALVHDVLEDTDFPEDELRAQMGPSVMEIVDAVTNDEALPWEEKKMKYIRTVKNGPEGAKAVAAADKIHNAESLLEAYEKEGREVWKHFNRGKEKKLWFEEEMLAMLRQEWKDPMVEEYAALVERMRALEA